MSELHTRTHVMVGPGRDRVGVDGDGDGVVDLGV